MPTVGASQVASIGFGAMSLTWPAGPIATDAEIFQVLKAAVENSKDGKLLINSATIYGPQDDPHANVKLIKRFLVEQPQFKDKVVLIVKGGMIIKTFREHGMMGATNSCAEKDLREDLADLRRELGCNQHGIKLDSYGPGRRDLTLSVEETITNLAQLQKEGLFDSIHLSEVGADTINKAAETAKKLGTSIGSVELEYSPFTDGIERNGVLDACKRHGIPILAYSPLGRGFLGGNIKSKADIPSDDYRLWLDTYSEENFSQNVELASKFADLATKRSSPVTSAQLALAWLVQQGDGKTEIIPIPGTTNAKRVTENMSAQDVKLDAAELAALRTNLGSTNFQGERYNAFLREKGNLSA